MEKKLNWQLIRGICIISVILIHCSNGMRYLNISTLDYNFHYWIVLRQIINFAVPIFIFMVGYFINTKTMLNENSYRNKRYIRLCFPYLFWTLIYSIINVVITRDINIKFLLKALFTGNAATQLYYILVLVQLLVITPFIIKRMKIQSWNILFFSITPVFLFFMYAFNFITTKTLPYYNLVFPAWFIFYYFGLYFNVNLKEVNKKIFRLKYVFVFPLLALLFSVIEAYAILHYTKNIGFAISQIKFSSFTYSFTLILLIVYLFESRQTINIKKNNILVKIGNYSYGIYFLHMIPIILFNKIYDILPYQIEFLPLVQFIQLSFTLVVCMIVIKFTISILGKEKANKYLGFSS